METQDSRPPFDISVPFKGEQEPELVHVVGLRTSFPPLADQAQLKTMVAAGLEQRWANLGDSEWATVADSAADPSVATKMLEGGHYQPDRGDTATLNLFPIDVKLTSLFPLFQPRISGDPATVPPPRIYGPVNLDGGPVACLVFEFEDEDHWRRQLEEQIKGTLSTGSDLRASILNHGVSAPIFAYPAVVRFGDVDIQVLGLADGITRAVRCWQNLLGADFREAELPGEIAARLLRRRIGRGATTESIARQQGRLDVYLDFVTKFGAYDQHYEIAEVVRIGQSLIVPAKVAVGFDIHQDSLTDEQQFRDAIAAAVAQIHTLATPWRASAVDANVIAQAIRRAATEGVLSKPEVDVATGEADLESLSEQWVHAIQSDPGLDEGLATAVWLVHRLTQPPVMKAVNRSIRGLKGIPRVTKNVFASMILSLIDRPWRVTKDASRGNAASAWRAGGPIPHEIYGSSRPWEPMLGDKYAALVPAALGPEHPSHWSALHTLQIAGGIALVADGLILAASGSTAVDGGFKRVQPHVLVSRLSSTVAGLYVLAHAADSFHSLRQASNSLTPDQQRKLISQPGPKPYPISRPNPDHPEIPVPDPNFGFDQIRSIAEPRGNGDDDLPEPTTVPPIEKFNKYQSQLEDSYHANYKALLGIIELAASNASIYEVGDEGIWAALDDRARVNWRLTEDIRTGIREGQPDNSVEDLDEYPEDDSEVLP